MEVFIIFVSMKITSEIIQNNLDKLQSLKSNFKILGDYENETNNSKLSSLYNEGRAYGLSSYLNFIDFIRNMTKLNQQVFYSKKITLKEFRECLIKNATDEKVKIILKSKGKVSFEKFINSPRWELYSGNKRRRGGYRYHDNFLPSTAIISNFCIQNELEIEDVSRISDWYTKDLPVIDPSIKKEIDLTNEVVNFMFKTLSNQNYDFRRINIENLKWFFNSEIERKMKEIEDGESVRLIELENFYTALSSNKNYKVLNKEIQSGRLNVSIKNDLGFVRSYPYRIFETITNLRNTALDDLLNDL